MQRRFSKHLSFRAVVMAGAFAMVFAPAARCADLHGPVEPHQAETVDHSHIAHVHAHAASDGEHNGIHGHGGFAHIPASGAEADSCCEMLEVDGSAALARVSDDGTPPGGSPIVLDYEYADRMPTASQSLTSARLAVLIHPDEQAPLFLANQRFLI